MLNNSNKNVKQNVTLGTPAVATISGFFSAANKLNKGVKHMGLFGSKKTVKELPPLFSEAEIDGATYDQVLDFLVSVNNDDYKKIIRVADLYRKTHCEVAKVTGLATDPQPSIFEQQPVAAPAAPVAPATDTEAGNFLDGDDDLAAAFLDDDEPTPPATTAPATKPTKVTVTDETDNLQS